MPDMGTGDDRLSAQPAMPRPRALLAEGLVVLLSILIAFALDAAWENRELRRELDQDLASVAAEVQANIEGAEGHIALAGRIVSTSNELLAALKASPEASTVAVVDTVVWWQAMTPTYEPSLGAIDAVIASGRMSAIEDRDLSRRLASLRSQIDDAVEEEFEAQRFFEMVQAPEVFEVLDLSTLSYLTEQFGGGGLTTGLGSRQEVSYPNSTSIRSAIEYRRYLYLDAIGSLQRVVEELEGIQAGLAAR